MKIPPPPFNTSSVYAADGGASSSSHVHEQGDGRQDDDANLNAYHGYYGSAARSSQNSSSGPADEDVGAAARQFPQQQFLGQRYNEYYKTARSIHDPKDDEQSAQRAGETSYDQSYGQRLERTHGEPFNDEVAAAPPAPSSSCSSIQGKILPNVFSLAQQLLPTVVKRLTRQEPLLRIEDYEDDFPGRCSPLGSPVKSTLPSTPVKQALISPFYGNFKTAGLEESDCEDDEEGGAALGVAGASVQSVDEGDDPMTEYLPRSAALLVSALQSSTRNVAKYDAGTLASSESLEDFFNSPRVRTRTMPFSPQTRTRTMDMESRADALLESIRKDDLNLSKKRRGESDVTQDVSVSGSSSQGLQDALPLPNAPSQSASAVAAPDDARAFFDDDDSVAGSISGDMAQLTKSIESIQRDLENVDFSHLEDVYDDGFGGVGGLEAYDGEGGLLTRLKLWFSRGMIMEQKLLNTYVNWEGNANDGNDEVTQMGGYTDNPVLVGSLALMWAFVVLILMHPKIAELVEGRDDGGQLADIIEWLFN
eukprot:CAMPEP_0172531428 /NCGR_PEP_ID=MMETSP1067-20121228/4846_1 /TAXON_ID=265564 ORGANISM="Thalassiosira punctigera, Strain Tpunct2005C2" /NCGR_SAMPLE_ID=MMETSP1067 /ASSEMBLY_ACC=CAM_ASM_000444 /LENGTH=534 /DNA_ID=CAMNT_0013315807 /DNA_START=65 /DNA_END=1669 /DNA_ORIENTATION=+